MVAHNRIEELLTVLDLATLLRNTLRERTRKLAGLTVEQAVVLCRIERMGGRATITQLARELARATHTISEMVNRMEHRDLVRRQRGANSDGREVVVELTAEGARRIVDYRLKASEILASLTEMSSDDLNARLAQVSAVLLDLLRGS